MGPRAVVCTTNMLFFFLEKAFIKSFAAFRLELGTQIVCLLLNLFTDFNHVGRVFARHLPAYLLLGRCGRVFQPLIMFYQYSCIRHSQ